MSQSNSKIYHFDLNTLAKTLKLTSIDVIKTSRMDIESHWYRSSGPADLYYWKTEDRIVKHQVSLFSQVVEWNEYDGVKTGYVNDDIEAGKAEVICFDQFVNQSVVDQAVRFLSCVEQVEPSVKDQLISHYQFYNRWQGFGFGKALTNLLKSLKFWKK